MILVCMVERRGRGGLQSRHPWLHAPHQQQPNLCSTPRQITCMQPLAACSAPMHKCMRGGGMGSCHVTSPLTPPHTHKRAPWERGQPSAQPGFVHASVSTPFSSPLHQPPLLSCHPPVRQHAPHVARREHNLLEASWGSGRPRRRLHALCATCRPRRSSSPRVRRGPAPCSRHLKTRRARRRRAATVCACRWGSAPRERRRRTRARPCRRRGGPRAAAREAEAGPHSRCGSGGAAEAASAVAGVVRRPRRRRACGVTAQMRLAV
eukprot:366238-Chlamydomonas_euryale.AAC.14